MAYPEGCGVSIIFALSELWNKVSFLLSAKFYINSG